LSLLLFLLLQKRLQQRQLQLHALVRARGQQLELARAVLVEEGGD
jgi:hypothetical protein